MTDSLKLIIIQDYAGNSLLSYLSKDTKTNPNLISGFISALNSFNKEVIGGDLKGIESTNGLKLRIGSLYIRRELYKRHLIYDSKLKPETRLFPQKINDELTGNYFLSTNNDSESRNEVYFSKILNSLSLERRIIYFLDPETKEVKYTLNYAPEYQFKAVSEGSQEELIHYCMVYDRRDEQLNDFVEQQFSKLEQLLKENVNVIGPALLWGNVNLLTKHLKQELVAFANSYELERKAQSVGKLLNDIPRLVKLNFDDKLVNEMKEKIYSVVKLLKF